MLFLYLFLAFLGFMLVGWRLFACVAFGFLVYLLYGAYVHEKVINLIIKIGDFICDHMPWL